MTKDYREPEVHENSASGVLAGVVVGAMAGAVTMLLLAPQSGEATRMQIQEKGIELRDRTTELVGDTLAQVRQERKQITVGTRRRAKEIFHQGQALVIDQLDHVSDAAQAGKKAIQNG